MTIRNPKLFMESVWDWSCLDGCLPNPKIKPTDIDGSYEVAGHFLHLETKKAGVRLPTGQNIYLERSVKRGDTVIIVWGDPGKPVEVEVRYPSGEVVRKPANLQDLREIVRQWGQYAQENPMIGGSMNLLRCECGHMRVKTAVRLEMWCPLCETWTVKRVI